MVFLYLHSKNFYLFVSLLVIPKITLYILFFVFVCFILLLESLSQYLRLPIKFDKKFAKSIQMKTHKSFWNAIYFTLTIVKKLKFIYQAGKKIANLLYKPFS